jgi:hypothetical protein
MVSTLVRATLAGAFALFSLACSGGGSSDGTASSCANLAGAWKVKAHCDPTLVGQNVAVTETGCSLSMAAPFNGFTGTVSENGKLTISGPQSCTGTATVSSISMTCTPGTCQVVLER